VNGPLADTTLIFFVWNRPEFFARVLDSWEKVPEVASVGRIAVALGRGREPEQAALARRFGETVGRKVELWPDSNAAAASPGSHRAEGEAVTRAFTDPACQFAIMTEEDNVVSGDVLKFITWARAQRDTPAGERILTVASHNPLGQGYQPQWDDTDADQRTARLVPHGFSSWGWCTWRDRWEKVLEPEWDWDCNKGDQPFNHGFDWQVDRISRRDGWVHLAPDASRTQSIGNYGLHTTQEIFEKTQAASFREHRDGPDTDYVLVAGGGP
jgi:hypothetical protein